ncbi:MAG: type II toxin-antitoxin system RelE/ParE family toxin [Thaumarchaeota archaeon]|nr:type II toxin-antitoxin system RelE/ParE family toxin [Nitrososphaerota archaeon]
MRKLQPSIRTRVLESMQELSRAPEIGEQLKPSRFWKSRAGDYRIIYEIDRHLNHIIILFVGHRKNVYDEFSTLI